MFSRFDSFNYWFFDIAYTLSAIINDDEIRFMVRLIGLHLLEAINLSWNSIALKRTKRKGYWGALILGLIFGVALGPCTFAYIAPMLGVVFTIASTRLIYASILLLAFALGHCSVIVLAGTLFKRVQSYLNWSEKSRISINLKKICGILVLLGGIYLVYIA